MKFISEHYTIPDSLEEKPSRARKRDLKSLIEWIKELEAQEISLKQIENQFLETRDSALLEPFKAKDKSSKITLKEPIEGSVYLSNIPELIANATDEQDRQICERIKNNLIEDAKLFNPNAEIITVEATDGSQLLAVIGVDFEAFCAFRELRDQERKVEREIERAQRDLNNAVVSSKAPEETQTYVPNSRNIGIHTLMEKVKSR